MIVPFARPDCSGYSIQYTYEELMYKSDRLLQTARGVEDRFMKKVYRKAAMNLRKKAEAVPAISNYID
ncbi:MAG: hypothetical protein IMZ61_04015, partial [Planctomycetes bacterium]|nr:hypothetical protein [Planctomycetota bacterium]